MIWGSLLKKKTSILSCSPTSCQVQRCWLLMLERAGWSRKEGTHGGDEDKGDGDGGDDVLSSVTLSLQLLSKKKRGQQRTVAAKHTKIRLIRPAWVKKGQSCSSQLLSGPVPSSQSGLPSHLDVRRMHFLVPFLHGTRYGSSVTGKLV